MKKSLLILCTIFILSVKLFATASWYGKDFKNMVSASGYIYSPDQFVCASNDYPFGTVLKVSNKKNSKSVVVVVIDTGSFKKKYGRKIDLSREAFRKIAKLGEGLIHVNIEVLSKKNTFRYKHGKPLFTKEEYLKFMDGLEINDV